MEIPQTKPVIILQTTPLKYTRLDTGATLTAKTVVRRSRFSARRGRSVPHDIGMWVWIEGINRWGVLEVQ